jgi:hypothetical protein
MILESDRPAGRQAHHGDPVKFPFAKQAWFQRSSCSGAAAADQLLASCPPRQIQPNWVVNCVAGLARNPAVAALVHT